MFGENKKLFARSLLGLKECLVIDAAVFACHGASGENGQLVSLFKLMDIPVSVGDVDGLGVCMNKFLFKQVMKGLKIPVVKGFKIAKSDYDNEEKRHNVELKLRLLTFPVVIKANSGGSSIGVFVAKNKEEFDYCLSDAFEFDDVVLVERFVKNAREFNVAVLGNGERFCVSEIDEPLKNEELLTFADKYLSGAKGKDCSKLKIGSMEGLKKRFPAEVDQGIVDRIKDYAAKIFKSLGLFGVVRIDFLFCEKSNKLYACEVNAIPGSLAYYFFCQGQVLINEFIERLIDVAETEHEKYKRFNNGFVTNVLE